MKTVLISGASFAGLSTAYWMNKFGYKVTIVELAGRLKKGGTPVNILENTIDIVKNMGIFDQIEANKLTMERMEFKNSADGTERTDLPQKKVETEYEIERDVLLNILFESVKADVEFIFGDSIVSLEEVQPGTGTDDGVTNAEDGRVEAKENSAETKDGRVEASFKTGQKRSFDLVFGCDGIHSVVRKLWFGPESDFSHFLQTYFSITIVNKLLIPENTTQLYSEPGKSIMLNSYNNKTDIVLCFFSEKEIPYDYRNEEQQRNIILDHFAGTGWRTPELLEEVKNSKTFYFDKLCQMKMPSWTKGRVALVGDAGYCASPAAGRGGSLAIDGAAALGEAFEKYLGNFEMAFREYNKSFRPFVEELQEQVVNFGLDALIPRTQEAIRKRNKEGFGF